jgi:hypothetical protein
MKFLVLDSSLTTNDYLDEDKLGTILIGLIRVKDDKYIDEIRSKFEQFIFDIIQRTIISHSKDIHTNKTTIKNNFNDQTSSNEESSINPRYTSISSNSNLFPSWFRLINNLLKSTEDGLNHLRNLSNLIIDGISKQQETNLPSISYLLHHIYDTIEDRLILVFNEESLRYQIHFERLSLDEYAQMVKLIENFIFNLNQFDVKYNSTPFKTFLQSQTSKFLTHFHNERKQRLANTLDNDQWRQVSI